MEREGFSRAKLLARRRECSREGFARRALIEREGFSACEIASLVVSGFSRTRQNPPQGFS